MIEFTRNPQQTIPESSVLVVGLGGAGGNMLDRIALDGMEGVDLVALHTDVRTLTGSVASEKVQLGKDLLRGLGAGGDPELGKQSAMEAESQIRDVFRDRKMIFLCVGLGGGTGSGASPLVARLAREAGAFVVVFATMPFVFEGNRRCQQAEAALNELAVLSNSLVTFENGKMGQLVLAKQGIHEAFAATNNLISESIKSVTRLVVRPGLINVGLDELMAALKTSKSRCLFGSGIAFGENRAQKAMHAALSSPLLDKGELLNDADTVLVHLCGGNDLTLYEVELLMRDLSKHLAAESNVLFGAAVDESMGESLSVTLISALPESKLLKESPSLTTSHKAASIKEDRGPSPIPAITPSVTPAKVLELAPEPKTEQTAEKQPLSSEASEELFAGKAPSVVSLSSDDTVKGKEEGIKILEPEEKSFKSEPVREATQEDVAKLESSKSSEKDLKSFEKGPEKEVATPVTVSAHPAQEEEETQSPGSETSKAASSSIGSFFGMFQGKSEPENSEEPNDPSFEKVENEVAGDKEAPLPLPSKQELLPSEGDEKKIPQGELELEGGPKGKFSGGSPNIVDGDDLDVPPFLRNR